MFIQTYPVLADIGAAVFTKLPRHAVLLLKYPRLSLQISETLDRYLDRFSFSLGRTVGKPGTR